MVLSDKQNELMTRRVDIGVTVSIIYCRKIDE